MGIDRVLFLSSRGLLKSIIYSFYKLIKTQLFVLVLINISF